MFGGEEEEGFGFQMSIIIEYYCVVPRKTVFFLLVVVWMDVIEGKQMKNK